jgi:hypothetical protein
LQGEVEAHRRRAEEVWNFFRDKTIRQTILTEFAGAIEVIVPEQSAAARERVEQLRRTVARYENDPLGADGRAQLMRSARELEEQAETIANTRGWLSTSSAAIEISIVLVSAAIASGVILLGWLGVALGAAGCIAGLTIWLVWT